MSKYRFLLFLLLHSSLSACTHLYEPSNLHSGLLSETANTPHIRVLYVNGTAYERGYQHGILLREQVRDNLLFLYKQIQKHILPATVFLELYKKAEPYIPDTYKEEMRGLADGSEIPLDVIHIVHILPSVTEWGGHKLLRAHLKASSNTEQSFNTSCSNIGAGGLATNNGQFYTVRILDWGIHRISKLHEYPLITIGTGPDTLSYVNIGWVGFLGAISGINEEGITLGEMGYGNPPNETVEGTPMPFLLREVMAKASSLKDVRKIIAKSPGTNSFAYLMSDGKQKKAELYIRDRDRFLVFPQGTEVKDKTDYYPALPQISYGGRYGKRMSQLLHTYSGQLSPKLFMKVIIPQIVMKGNFQNVVYDPANLSFWVNYSRSPGVRAAKEAYTYFDFKSALTGCRKKGLCFP